MMRRSLLATALLITFAHAAWAQDPIEKSTESAAEDPAHEELRAFRKQVVEAIGGNDIEKVLPYLTDNVVVTWQNGEVSRGPDEVRKYYDRMMKGPSPVVKSLSSNPVPDQLTNLFGDVGVAHGSSEDHFVLTDGQDFNLKTVWSATVVKQNGAWKIASFHASTNMFDNAVLWLIVRKIAIWVGVGAGLIGIVLGALIVGIAKRRKGAAHAAV